MLTEKRYEVILKCLNEKNSITVTELKELFGISESTIRRDLTALDKAGDKFDKKEFHRFVLETGPAPFPVIEKYVLENY